jgi:DNA-binding PadR family transcriptional regulator
MSETKFAGDEARTDDDAPRTEKPDGNFLGQGETHIPDEGAVLLTDGGTLAANGSGDGAHRIPELSAFRRDILLTLAKSQPTNGRGLLDDLSTLRDEEIGDARLYPNLNDLVHMYLVEKRENYHDERSHEYRLADAGRSALREHAQRVQAAVDALNEGGEAGR